MENRCRVVLETLFDKPFIRCKPFKDMGSYLEIDCYNDEMKLGLEYDGWQHRKFPPFWKANIPIKERDREKEILCKRKNILLIRVNDLEATQTNLIDVIIEKFHSNDISFDTPNRNTLLRLRTPTNSIYKRIYGTPYLQNLHNICKKQKGKLLDKAWAGNHHKYRILCRKNHKFSTTYYNIVAGCWCPSCAIERITRAAHSRKIGIERCRGIAVKRNGLCLSKSYTDARTRMKWKCNKHNIKWRATAAEVIISGTWCPKCGHENAVKPRKIRIEACKQAAIKRGGICLSEEHIGYKIPLRWWCKKHNFKWNASARQVVRQKHWCRKCGYEEVSRKLKNSGKVKQ
jgi:predicted RNA-binding Zn-ribbon protein involved in translation (DUF1610 family)/predicted nucleic-acid-binding Zn-ribbon protein